MTDQNTPYYSTPKKPRLIWNDRDKRKAAEPLPTQDDFELDFEGISTDRLPTKLNMGTPRLLDFVQSAQTPILVFNDEAHHVHDEAVHYGKSGAFLKDEDAREGIAWNRVLIGIQKQQGLSLQLDLSATLFEKTTRQWFKHTVYDYPLQQAIKDGIVKKPFLGKIKLQYKDGYDEAIPEIDDSQDDPFDKYTQLIQAGIAEWKKEQAVLDFAGQRVLSARAALVRGTVHQAAHRGFIGVTRSIRLGPSMVRAASTSSLAAKDKSSIVKPCSGICRRWD